MTKIRIGTHRGKPAFVWGTKSTKRTRLIRNPENPAAVDQQRIELMLELREGGLQRKKPKTLEEHIQDYIKLTAANAKEHTWRMKEQRLRRVLSAAGIKRIEQLVPGLIETTICSLRKIPQNPKHKEENYPLLSEQSRDHMRRTVKGFARYLWMERITDQHLLINLRLPKVKIRPNQRDRFHPQELQKLVADPDPRTIEGMSPIDRSWLYLLAATTGYRRGELASISTDSFDLDSDPPTLTVRAAYSKNREFACQPLRADIVPALRDWLQDRNGPVFPNLDGRKSAKMIRIDMAHAGIPRDTDRGRRCFHALRNTYISSLGDAGMQAKEVQLLARHSTINLTMGYMMPGQDLARRAAAAIPPLTPRGVPGGTVGGTEAAEES